jgi:prepilin-type processing-associated H-X9-DG protein
MSKLLTWAAVSTNSSIEDFNFSQDICTAFGEDGTEILAGVACCVRPVSSCKSTGFIWGDGATAYRTNANLGLTLEYRHNNRCNGLYGDGHVEDIPKKASTGAAADYGDGTVHDLFWSSVFIAISPWCTLQHPVLSPRKPGMSSVLCGTHPF